MSDKSQFSKCNGCGEVFFDTNPSDQPFFEIPKDKGFNSLTTQEDEGGLFQGCPNCEDDGMLQDVIDENEL